MKAVSNFFFQQAFYPEENHKKTQRKDVEEMANCLTWLSLGNRR